MSDAGLDVVVSYGNGRGPTELAAFDAALQAAGVAHLNLIRLSSLIPAGSSIHVRDAPRVLEGGWGDRLYAVYSDHRVVMPGERACAGLGWVQDVDSGAGVLVEHVGHDEQEVEVQLAATLDDVAARRPGRFERRGWRITSVRCEGQPVAAVVVAAYRVEAW